LFVFRASEKNPLVKSTAALGEKKMGSGRPMSNSHHNRNPSMPTSRGDDRSTRELRLPLLGKNLPFFAELPLITTRQTFTPMSDACRRWADFSPLLVALTGPQNLL
jgi:hypothetical protein